MKMDKQINRMRELMEIRIQKQPLDHGNYHAVFPSQKHPDRVIKTGHDGDINDEDAQLEKVDPDHIRVFQSRPDLFPLVYRVGPEGRWIEIENLRTTEVYLDDDFLAHEIHTVENRICYEGISQLYRWWHDNRRKGIPLPESLSRFSPKAQELVQRYMDFFDRCHAWASQHTFTPNRAFDFHKGQIGYTKDGQLKLLDF